MRDVLASAGRVLLACGIATGSTAQKIESTTWGFDGIGVAPGFFNPLTVVVRNASNAPVDDMLMLVESNGLRDVGAPLAERCYLAPGAQRVVQFHAFVTTTDHAWSLRWGNAGFARVAIRPPPVPAWRGAVVLCEGDAPRGPIQTVPAFPAAWFPAIPGAAEALADAVLDFAPDWDAARAGAFLAWVRSGGRVHLLPRDGQPPAFSGVLAVLNDPRPQFFVGSGLAWRYEEPLAKLTPAALQRGLQPPAEANAPATARGPSVLSQLQLSLLPQHPWGWIFGSAIAFLFCIGPVHWQFAKHRIDWRLSIGYLLAVVLAFTVLFGWLGARGYDEVSRVRTLAYARVCGDGELAVTQYTNAFVTTGGRRLIRPRAAASLLSTAQTHEAVDGIVDNGAGGQLAVDMPMFSARGIVHRAHYQVDELPVVRVVSGTELLVEGAVTAPRGGFLLQGGHLWSLRTKGDRLLVEPLQDVDAQGRFIAHLPSNTAEPEPALVLELVCERLQLRTAKDPAFNNRSDRAFVLFPSPPELHLDQTGGLGAEVSFVLYDFDLD